MGLSLPKPGRRMTPEEYFSEHVPQLWPALWQGNVPDWVFGIVCEVGAQAFLLQFAAPNDGGLRVTVLDAPDNAPEPPLLHIIADVESWRIGALEVTPQLLRKLEKRLPSNLERLRQSGLRPQVLSGHPGTVQLHYSDDAGDEATAEIRIAGGQGPRAQIHATDRDLWGLLKSGQSLSAILRSRVRVDGDLPYLLRLARALGDAS